MHARMHTRIVHKTVPDRRPNTLVLHYYTRRSLPPELGSLVNLEHLYLSFNRLTELPRRIVQCRRLLRLAVDHNQLECLPPQVDEFTALRCSLPLPHGHCCLICL